MKSARDCLKFCHNENAGTADRTARRVAAIWADARGGVWSLDHAPPGQTGEALGSIQEHMGNLHEIHWKTKK